MRTLGLIGGMSPESTAVYYKRINESINEKLGGFNCAKMFIYSFNFKELVDLNYDLPLQANKIEIASQSLERAGADCIVICANTMHVHAQYVQSRVSIPLLNIVDATAERIKKDKIVKIGLLGTQFTMDGEFYVGRMKKMHGLDVMVPDALQKKEIHEIIYSELCSGVFKEESRKKIMKAIVDLKEKGCEGIVLGCTELPPMVESADMNVPIYDTLAIHVEKAVQFALL